MFKISVFNIKIACDTCTTPCKKRLHSSLLSTKFTKIFIPRYLNHCTKKITLFEDNNGCIEDIKCTRLSPRGKDIGIIYHHYRRKVADGTLKVFLTHTKDQNADIFIQPLTRDQFCKL